MGVKKEKHLSYTAVYLADKEWRSKKDRGGLKKQGN